MESPKYPPKFSKVLVTPDPQYIPGYAGYCPQLKYNMGQTYGQLTYKLLTSPEVRRSQRLLLSTGRLQTADIPDRTHKKPDRTPEQAGDEVVGTTRLPRGEHRDLDTVVPGCTGFVPKRQAYSQTRRGAITEFTRDQNPRLRSQASGLPAVSYSTPEFQARTLNTPLRDHQPTSLRPPGAWEPLGSPYLMDECSPHKYFISGFTGYVPKSRFLIGRGYPATTNEALVQFGREAACGLGWSADDPRKQTALPPIPSGYPSSHGLLPFYTGHVPGYKFMYGDTFGKLTHNALGMSNVKRSIGVKS